MTPAAQRRLARLLAVVGVLLGLLAMHGLASSHHASAAALGASDSAAVHAGHAAGVHASSDHATAVHAAAAHAADAGSSCDGDCALDLATLCLAVLSAGLAAVAAAVAGGRSRPHPVRTGHHTALPSPGPPLRLRPPDPVRDLCISRT